MAWNEVYSHDKDGKKIKGDKRKLIANIRKGAPTRVGFAWNAAGDLFFAPTSIVGVVGDDVFAQLSWMGISSPSDGLLPFTEPSAAYIVNVSTKGRVVRRFVSSTSPAVEEQNAQWSLIWFVGD